MSTPCLALLYTMVVLDRWAHSHFLSSLLYGRPARSCFRCDESDADRIGVQSSLTIDSEWQDGQVELSLCVKKR